MNKAVIVFTPKNHILGQSIGFVAPLRRNMRLGRLVRVCRRLANGSEHERVSINIIGAHNDLEGNCLSIAFHFQISATPISGDTFAHRSRIIRQWLCDEFNVSNFDEKAFPSREELCGYLHDPLMVM